VRPLRPQADLRSLTAVRTMLTELGPALLHTHTAKAGSVGRLAALSVRRRPVLVHTFHGHVLEGYFDAATRAAFLEIERGLARRTDALVAVSEEIRDQLLALGIGRPDQFHVVPLGLDLGPYLAVERPGGQFRASLRIRPETPLVGIVGRLVPIKDHETLLKALTRLPDVHLAVIGDGELRTALTHRVAGLGLADRVHFTGWCADMAAALSDLDAVVLSSRNEGTPLALIEASAAGRPVVATDVGGVRSVVEDQVTGLLTPPGDDHALASAVARVLADAPGRARMGLAGREHVRERFGHARMVTEVRCLYDDLLQSAIRRRRPRASQIGSRFGGRVP
ncbi:MAG TPA: glycosyltransferase, partial [Acidimicrobiales bacterium]|nr:glycosyltransferase [Acidimicrobiales bacterium]